MEKKKNIERMAIKVRKKNAITSVEQTSFMEFLVGIFILDQK